MSLPLSIKALERVRVAGELLERLRLESVQGAEDATPAEEATEHKVVISEETVASPPEQG